MIVADTNVVSEFMRTAPDPGVLAWAAQVRPGDLTISAVTVQEIEHGILLLPAGKRRQRLDDAWQGVLAAFATSVLAYDHEGALHTARILTEAQQAGRPMALADAQIAGTCRAHDADLATRNTADFDAVRGLNVVNPFAA